MEITFIPVQYYTNFYFFSLLLVVLLTFSKSLNQSILSEKTLNYNKVIGPILLVFVVIYMGLRPIDGRYFGDMGNYSRYFEGYAQGMPITATRDLLFHNFTKWASQIMSVNMYFLVCAGLYIVPLYVVCKKWFKSLWFYGFIFLIGAFSFWAYGTNGIRNGIAGSLFLWGISRDKRVWQVVLILLAINFHKTMLLPTVGFLLANFYNKPKIIIAIWVLCIPLSLVGGGFFENLFGSIGFDDDRMGYLTDGNVNDDEFSSTGFRWDFLIYSATAVFSGWYFIVKRKFNDKTYFLLFNTYMFANAFWILVIRANFSNRFAYLSWFMIGLVIIYPLLSSRFFTKQHKLFGQILLAYFAFTFLMNVILMG